MGVLPIWVGVKVSLFMGAYALTGAGYGSRCGEEAGHLTRPPIGRYRGARGS